MMQATTVKRFSVGAGNRVQRIGIATIAIGTLAIGLVGGYAINDSINTNDTQAAVTASGVVRVADTHRFAFIEENIWLPVEGTSAAVRGSAEFAFLEENLWLPSEGGAGTALKSYADLQFVQENTLLPGAGSPQAHSLAEVRFQEENFALPGGTDSYLPMPQDGQSVGGDY